jgi:Glu-tRNA(Gln) amidotransferase subunit E-like FAD-binding protein
MLFYGLHSIQERSVTDICDDNHHRHVKQHHFKNQFMYSPTCMIYVDLEPLRKTKKDKLSVIVIVIDVCNVQEEILQRKAVNTKQ